MSRETARSLRAKLSNYLGTEFTWGLLELISRGIGEGHSELQMAYESGVNSFDNFNAMGRQQLESDAGACPNADY